MAEHPSAPEPSLTESVVRVVEAGHRLVLDRIDLARFDLAQLAARILRGTALIAAGTFLLAGSWFAVMGGAVVWLDPYLPLAASLFIVGLGTAALGAGAVAVGVLRARSADTDARPAAAIGTPHDATARITGDGEDSGHERHAHAPAAPRLG